MKYAVSAVFYISAAMILMWITGSTNYLPALNIKQAVSVEVLYLIAMAIFGWQSSVYTEDLARMINSCGTIVQSIIVQLIMLGMYLLVEWINK